MYYYKGQKISLKEYKQRMPNRKISQVYENLEDTLMAADGTVALEHGIPFILVSDYYSKDTNDQELFKEYLKQIQDPNAEQKITRVYIYSPIESFDYFLYNQQEALKNDPDDRDENLDVSIGNQLSTYRLLSFMLEDGSNFLEVYENWINTNVGLSEAQKTQSLKRLGRMRDIMKELAKYEEGLVAKEGNSKSK
jgi:hypothetical protein